MNDKTADENVIARADVSAGGNVGHLDRAVFTEKLGRVAIRIRRGRADEFVGGGVAGKCEIETRIARGICGDTARA